MTSRERWLQVLAGERVDPPLRWELHGYEPECFVTWAPQGYCLDQRPEVFFGLDLLDFADVYWGPLPTAFTTELFEARAGGRWHRHELSSRGVSRRAGHSWFAGGPPATDGQSLYDVQRCYNAHSPARYPLESARGPGDELPVALVWPGLSMWLAEVCRPELIEGALQSDDGLWEETATRFFLLLDVVTETYVKTRRADVVLIAEQAATRARLARRWDDTMARYAAVISCAGELGLRHVLAPDDGSPVRRRAWLDAGATGLYADGHPLDLRAVRGEVGPEIVLAGGLAVDDLQRPLDQIERQVAEVIEPAAAAGPVVVSLERPVTPATPLDHYRAYLNFVERPPSFEYFRARRDARRNEDAQSEPRGRRPRRRE